jgi:hypothetical protein
MTFEEERTKLHKEIYELREALAELQRSTTKESWLAYFKRKLDKFNDWMDNLSNSNGLDFFLFLSILFVLVTIALIGMTLAICLLKEAILLSFIPFAGWVFYQIYKNVKD